MHLGAEYKSAGVIRWMIWYWPASETARSTYNTQLRHCVHALMCPRIEMQMACDQDRFAASVHRKCWSSHKFSSIVIYKHAMIAAARRSTRSEGQNDPKMHAAGVVSPFQCINPFFIYRFRRFRPHSCTVGCRVEGKSDVCCLRWHSPARAST